MSIPLRLVKRLEHWPDTGGIDPLSLRTFQGPADIDAWLFIHQAVFGPARGVGRPWRRSDFRREFLEKPGWGEGSMWFADAEGLNPIGTVCWTPSVREPSVADIRWLAVVPAWRRRGVARCLLRRAEQDCLERGFARARLETLAQWEAAVALYRACGYVEEE